MPSFACAILEMRSSLAFWAISISEAIDLLLLCCGMLGVWRAKHYKGCPKTRTLTEVKTKCPTTGRSSGRQHPTRSAHRRLPGRLQRLSAAVAQPYRLGPAFCDLDGAVFELRDFAEGIERRIGQHVRRRLVVA